jgi:REP element-mobilizing transposase RayT
VPQSFACLHHHLIFSTRNRHPLIAEALQPRLYEYIGGILRESKCCLVAAGGMPDHIHLLIDLSRELTIAEAVRLVKSNSSKWIHETFPDQKAFAWQTGYGALAVSYSNLESVKRYLASQAEHHRKLTFQEEFLAFLNRHKIPYEERYLWE